MEYTTFQDLKLSALGLGVMRMPVIAATVPASTKSRRPR